MKLTLLFAFSVILPPTIHSSSTFPIDIHRVKLQSILNEIYEKLGRLPVLGIVSGEECLRSIYLTSEQLDWRSAKQWTIATRIQQRMRTFLRTEIAVLNENTDIGGEDIWRVVRWEESLPPSPKLLINSVFYSFIIDKFDLMSLRLLALAEDTKMKLFTAILIDGKVELLSSLLAFLPEDFVAGNLKLLLGAALQEPRAASIDALHDIVQHQLSSSSIFQFTHYLAQAAIVHDHLTALRYLSLHSDEYLKEHYIHLIGYAVRFGRCRPLQWLLSNSPDNNHLITEKDAADLESSIIAATEYDNFEAIQFLLLDGKQPRLPFASSISLSMALRNAVGRNCRSLVDLLLLKGPSDQRIFQVSVGPDLLTVAVENDQLEMLKYLLQRERHSNDLFLDIPSGEVVQRAIVKKNIPILSFLLTELHHYWNKSMVGQWAVMATESDFLPGLSLLLTPRGETLDPALLDALFQFAFDQLFDSILLFLLDSSLGVKAFPQLTFPYRFVKEEDDYRDQLVRRRHDVVWSVCKWINPRAMPSKFQDWNNLSRIQRHNLLDETFKDTALSSSCCLQ